MDPWSMAWGDLDGVLEEEPGARCASSTTGARAAVIGTATMVDADLALYVLSSSTLVC